MSFGIKMRLKYPLESLKTSKRLIVLSAGCCVNFICFAVLYFMRGNLTATGAVHLLTGLFNILPAGTLDGGRILCTVLTGLGTTGYHAEKICNTVSFATAFLLLALGIYVFILSRYNISLVITALYLAITAFKRQKRLN